MYMCKCVLCVLEVFHLMYCCTHTHIVGVAPRWVPISISRESAHSSSSKDPKISLHWPCADNKLHLITGACTPSAIDILKKQPEWRPIALTDTALFDSLWGCNAQLSKGHACVLRADLCFPNTRTNMYVLTCCCHQYFQWTGQKHESYEQKHKQIHFTPHTSALGIQLCTFPV